MSNVLNITLSNFVKNKNLCFIGEVLVYIKEQQSAGSSSADTATVRPLGIMNDEKPLKIKKEYATLKRGVPRKTLRRDLLEETTTLEGTLNQIQKETLALVLNKEIDTTTGATDRILLGSDVPANVYWSVILEGVLNTGDPLAIFLRNVQFTAEDVELMFGADDYSGIAFIAECLADEHPLDTNPDWDFVGEVSLASCGTTSADETVTLADTSDVYVGMYIVGAGIPVGSYVESIITDTSFELNNAATATEAVVTLYGENMNHADALKEDIGFLAFAR